jgi:hypothetical protein
MSVKWRVVNTEPSIRAATALLKAVSQRSTAELLAGWAV